MELPAVQQAEVRLPVVMPCVKEHWWINPRSELTVEGHNCVIRTCIRCQCSQIVWSKKARLEGMILGPSFNGRTAEWHSANGGSTPPGSTG